MRLYTAQQLIAKYAGKFIDTYPHHYEKRDNKGNWITMYEVRSVKQTLCENHNLPEQEIVKRDYD